MASTPYGANTTFSPPGKAHRIIHTRWKKNTAGMLDFAIHGPIACSDLPGLCDRVCALFAASGCLYSPPDQLPSSVRILYSKVDVDSLTGGTDIWFMVARKGNELRLTGDEGTDTQPFFAPGIRRVFFDRYVIYNGKLISVELITAMLKDYARPRLMTEQERAGFLQEYFFYSGWIPFSPTPTPTRMAHPPDGLWE